MFENISDTSDPQMETFSTKAGTCFNNNNNNNNNNMVTVQQSQLQQPTKQLKLPNTENWKVSIFVSSGNWESGTVSTWNHLAIELIQEISRRITAVTEEPTESIIIKLSRQNTTSEIMLTAFSQICYCLCFLQIL